MALTVTLAQMTTWARQRAHMEVGGPLSDQEWTDLLNAGIRKLYRELAQVFGAEYFGFTATLSTTANVETVPLPLDFLKESSLWWNDGSGTLKRIRRATEDELESQLLGSGWGIWIGRAVEECGVRYAIRNAALRFVPTPTAVHSLRLNYIRAPVALALPGATLDGYVGFEEYPVWDAAAAALAKEESDPGFAISMRDEVLRAVKATAERDQSEPLVIQDATGWWGE
jgi:hypothetical protein